MPTNKDELPNTPLGIVPLSCPAGNDVKDAPEPENVVAVIRLALKDPEASLATIVEAPFADAAVVLAFATVPVVT